MCTCVQKCVDIDFEIVGSLYAVSEDAKFELSIAVKEKDHAASKATLGRRHRGLGKQRSAEDLNAAPAAAL